MPKALGCFVGALLVGCAPALETPDQLLITCADDTSCPNDWHCTSAGVCAHGDETSAPTVFSVTATSTTTVVIGFSKPLLDSVATNATRYQIDHDVTVQSASIDRAHTAVTLTTSTQQARHYSLTIAGDIVDVYGAVIDPTGLTQTFLGIGDPVDESAPGLLAPTDRATVTDVNVTLSWTLLRGAVSYTVDVATSPDFTTPIPNSPWTVMAPATQQPITLPGPGSYYWRVRGDTTLAENTNLGRFALLVPTIAVYCAAGDNCEVGALNPTAWENGNPTTPFKTINRAINAAIVRGTTIINVAARADDGSAAYEESFELTGVFTLQGGWEPTFTTHDSATHVTAIAVSSPVRIVGARGAAPSIMDGFTIAPVRALDADLEITDSTSALGISHLTATAIRVVSTGTSGPILTSLIAKAVTLTGGAPRLGDSTVTGTLDVDSSDGAVVDNVIGSAVTTLANSPTVTGGALGQLRFAQGTAHVDGAWVTGVSGDINAIHTDPNAWPTITNCVIGTPAVPRTVVFESSSGGAIHFTNNTLLGTLSLATLTTLTVTNNLIACIDPTATAAGLEQSDSPDLSYENNVALGCASLFYTTEPRGRTYYDTDADLTGVSDNMTMRFANNPPLASALGDIFTSDMHVLATAPDIIRHGGKDTTQSTCGPDGTAACGAVTTDKDGVPRTSLVSVGAYEVDP